MKKYYSKGTENQLIERGFVLINYSLNKGCYFKETKTISKKYSNVLIIDITKDKEITLQRALKNANGLNILPFRQLKMKIKPYIQDLINDGIVEEREV